MWGGMVCIRGWQRSADEKTYYPRTIPVTGAPDWLRPSLDPHGLLGPKVQRFQMTNVYRVLMVRALGLEPRTNALKGRCSTN
jgi:hypothetical protein